MKNRIFLKHWLSLKPANYSSNTDLYYLKIANKIYSQFNKHVNALLSQYLTKNEILLLCCFLTCYFEDIISDTNLWKTFKALNKDIYNKELPFYLIDDNYINDEFNFEDISFLTWYFLNTTQKDKFIGPYNDLIFDVSTLTMQIFEDEYEYAPENDTLNKFFQFNNNDDKLYSSRAFIQYVFFENYLFYTDVKYQLDIEHLEVLEDSNDEDLNFLMSYTREITETFTYNNVSSLLALHAKDWAAKLLGKEHPYYKSINSISRKITGLFLYKGQNEDFVTLEHIASSMSFDIIKESLDHYENLDEDDIIYIGLAKYEGNWWFTGNFSVSEFDANIILDQKNSQKARTDVNFLRDQKKIKNIISEQEKAFLEFNDNSHIAFMKTNDLNTFTSNFMTFYNNSINSNSNDLEEAKLRQRQDGFFGGDSCDFEDVDDEVVVFFNSVNGLEIYNNIINAFPDKNNIFFYEESAEDIMRLLISPYYSTEFVNYFVKTYRNKLSFFKNEPNKSYLNDLDFLLRFWKNNNYKTEHNIIITG